MSLGTLCSGRENLIAIQIILAGLLLCDYSRGLEISCYLLNKLILHQHHFGIKFTFS